MDHRNTFDAAIVCGGPGHSKARSRAVADADLGAGAHVRAAAAIIMAMESVGAFFIGLLGVGVTARMVAGGTLVVAAMFAGEPPLRARTADSLEREVPDEVP